MTTCRLAASITGGIAIVGVAVGYAAIQPHPLFDPEVEVRHEKYSDVRERFRTRLVRSAASPQRDMIVLQRPAYVEEIEYGSGDLRLRGWMSGHQAAHRPLPAVLFLHGGFELGVADWEMALPFWEQGFVLMLPMLRGENGQPGTFSFLYDEVEDVLAARDYLANHPAVDPAHIYLAGHSAGGTLALLAALASERFKAVASFDASPDQRLLYNGRASKPGHHAEVVFDPSDAVELEVRSPLAYVLSLQSPVRLYYSYEAAVLAQRPSRRFAALARSRDIDARAIRVWGSHITHVARAMPRSIEFFKQHMGAESERSLGTRSAPPPEPSLVGNTTFFLEGYGDARVVALAGSFNGWDSRHLICGKEGTGWICRVDLPAGKYLYQFVVDDGWMTDPGNPLVDGVNGENASVIIKQ